MQKLKKKKKQTFLLNYPFFLKNNNLKKKICFNKILFENQILFNYNDLNVINNYENITLPITSKSIYTVKNKYKNQNLFNYNLNYNIIINFNKIILKKFLNKKKTIKGCILKIRKKEFLIYIFGCVFKINPKKLNIFYKKNKNKYYFLMKKKKLNRFIKFYMLRCLNFSIINNLQKKQNKTKIIFSRTLYINKLIKKKKNNNKIFDFKFF